MIQKNNFMASSGEKALNKTYQFIAYKTCLDLNTKELSAIIKSIKELQKESDDIEHYILFLKEDRKPSMLDISLDDINGIKYYNLTWNGTINFDPKFSTLVEIIPITPTFKQFYRSCPNFTAKEFETDILKLMSTPLQRLFLGLFLQRVKNSDLISALDKGLLSKYLADFCESMSFGSCLQNLLKIADYWVVGRLHGFWSMFSILKSILENGTNNPCLLFDIDSYGIENIHNLIKQKQKQIRDDIELDLIKSYIQEWSNENNLPILEYANEIPVGDFSKVPFDRWKMLRIQTLYEECMKEETIIRNWFKTGNIFDTPNFDPFLKARKEADLKVGYVIASSIEHVQFIFKNGWLCWCQKILQTEMIDKQ